MKKRVTYTYTSGIDIRVLDLRKNLNKGKLMHKEEISKAVNNYGAEVIVVGCAEFLCLVDELSKELDITV